MPHVAQRMLHAGLVALSLALLTNCASVDTVERSKAEKAAEVDAEVVRGREQMIRAFDAAWVRVVSSGKLREILDTEPVERPGFANSFVVRMADCLPLPELTPYPEEPVGMLKEILDSGTVRRMQQDVPSTPGSTSFYFRGLTDRYFEAVLEELGDHYGVTIDYEDIGYPPGRLPSTSALLNDDVDVVGQLNATGGRTQNMRRRTSRRFTCTMLASSQFIQIPRDSEIANEINSLNDLMDRPDLRICAGPLTTQTAKAYLPEHTVMTRYIDDIAQCDERIRAGKADLMINPLPDLSIAGLNDYKTVHTLIVAGTPLWVAQEGVICDIAPPSGKGEPECRELDPL